MAKLLEQKNRLDSAIAQILMARQLDPNSVDAAIALGELLCRAGRAQDAADAVGQVKTDTQLDKARVLLVSGWAKRQLGDLKFAENSLLEATILNPESSRALFELGKVYQATGQTDKAVDCYRKALALVFGEATNNGSRPQRQD